MFQFSVVDVGLCELALKLGIKIFMKGPIIMFALEELAVEDRPQHHKILNT